MMNASRYIIFTSNCHLKDLIVNILIFKDAIGRVNHV